MRELAPSEGRPAEEEKDGCEVDWRIGKPS